MKPTDNREELRAELDLARRRDKEEPRQVVRSSEWVGDAPPMTPECESGLWVVWWNDQWAAASCTFVSENRLSITVLHAKERVSTIGLNAAEVRMLRWGGRLAVNGAYPREKLSGGEPEVRA